MKYPLIPTIDPITSNNRDIQGRLRTNLPALGPAHPWPHQQGARRASGFGGLKGRPTEVLVRNPPVYTPWNDQQRVSEITWSYPWMVGRKTFFLFHFWMWDLFSGASRVSFREGHHRFGSTGTQDAGSSPPIGLSPFPVVANKGFGWDFLLQT